MNSYPPIIPEQESSPPGGVKRLRRSASNRVFAGICGGLGEYFGIEPTLVRLVWLIAASPGGGVILYLIGGLVIPLEPAPQAVDPDKSL
ncbi:MAG: PspC domain-containing protein [Calditrichota bacterium]